VQRRSLRRVEPTSVSSVFVHAISYKRLAGLFALEISEGALDSLFRGARRRGRGDPDPAAPGAGDRQRRNHRAGRRPDLLELGVPERRRGDPRDPAEPVFRDNQGFLA
jgi:hypothetical protein